ncbi:hypothetical protein OGAPHI_006365 [Ogataea philodendri]|uniref:Thymidylate kinase n=1 Tax=Ogataea philodendri TaxID=1378263 RepID=A0A9P8NXS4_9ASCO|nr:uncharacterized protein OGAPHI_006365 [Ogataea philodendri]KAH3661517.1 hypothetical protein OGAPHI_006365 [Ogataea philodendri]
MDFVRTGSNPVAVEFFFASYFFMTRGTLIAIEGLDRTGKTTQTTKLINRLAQDGKDVELIKFPERTTAIGKIINTYLTDKTFQLSDESAHLLFSANRWELSQKIYDLLDQGKTVVLDRYVYSGVAYSSAKGLLFDWCYSPDIGLPRPDVVIFLKFKEEENFEREGFGDERYEVAEFQQKVKIQFEKFSGQDNWKPVFVDGKNIEEVGELVWKCYTDATKQALGPVQNGEETTNQSPVSVVGSKQKSTGDQVVLGDLGSIVKTQGFERKLVSKLVLDDVAGNLGLEQDQAEQQLGKREDEWVVLKIVGEVDVVRGQFWSNVRHKQPQRNSGPESWVQKVGHVSNWRLQKSSWQLLLQDSWDKIAVSKSNGLDEVSVKEQKFTNNSEFINGEWITQVVSKLVILFGNVVCNFVQGVVVDVIEDLVQNRRFKVKLVVGVGL